MKTSSNLPLGGQDGEIQSIIQPKNSDSAKDTHVGVKIFSSLEEQHNEKIVIEEKPKIFYSAKEPLVSMVDDMKPLGGQVQHRPTVFVLANECKKIFEQIPLRKPTFEELFKLFGIIIIAENKFNPKPTNCLGCFDFNTHWLCGAHQKLALIWWLFEHQFYYLTEQMLIINSGI